LCVRQLSFNKGIAISAILVGNMKTLIWVGITIGSTLGAWLGSLIDHDPLFGPWSLLGGTIGSFVGIWVGYKIGKNYLG
jgi:uncharacterized membrane protein YfcA